MQHRLSETNISTKFAPRVYFEEWYLSNESTQNVPIRRRTFAIRIHFYDYIYVSTSIFTNQRNVSVFTIRGKLSFHSESMHSQRSSRNSPFFSWIFDAQTYDIEECSYRSQSSTSITCHLITIIRDIQFIKLHQKEDNFAKASTNLTRYRSENNFVYFSLIIII